MARRGLSFVIDDKLDGASTLVQKLDPVQDRSCMVEVSKTQRARCAPRRLKENRALLRSRAPFCVCSSIAQWAPRSPSESLQVLLAAGVPPCANPEACPSLDELRNSQFLLMDGVRPQSEIADHQIITEIRSTYLAHRSYFNWTVHEQKSQITFDDVFTHCFQSYGSHRAPIWTGKAYLFHSHISAAIDIHFSDHCRQAFGWAGKGLIRQIPGLREYFNTGYGQFALDILPETPLNHHTRNQLIIGQLQHT
jgi:hypothetical protein